VADGKVGRSQKLRKADACALDQTDPIGLPGYSSSNGDIDRSFSVAALP
jgi:hypothetical protein